MSRISRSNVLRVIKAVQEMGTEQKLKLADEIFASEPNLLGSVLVLRNLGVSPSKQEFALEMLFLCFEAIKESGLIWPLIAEDEQENMVVARHWEPYDARVSRTVLGERRGEIPLRYSLSSVQTV